jgi:hypothetical protein
MKRVISILLRSAGFGVSAVLLAALLVTAVLWPMSYRRAEVLIVRPWRNAPDVNARTNMGSVVALVIDDPTTPPGGPVGFLATDKPERFWLHMLGNVDAKFDVGGVRFKQHVWSHGRRDSLLVVPFYLIMLVLLVGGSPAAVVIARWLRRRRRFAAGCCPRCGYDLRASPQRCPECGGDAQLTPAAVGSSSPAS